MTRLVHDDRIPPFASFSVLQRIQIPSIVDRTEIPDPIESGLRSCESRIEAFQDRWDQPQIEQFVAADYRLVFQSLNWAVHNQPMIGRRFLEWGCGFAVVSVLAECLALNAIGIEAESVLLEQGHRTVADWQSKAELVHGNFLPPGSEDLADDPTLPSIGHEIGSAYQSIGLDLDDFAIVYAYPWPGEDDFHERVFDRHGAAGALLMLFCGPNDVRLWRKDR